MISKIKIVNDIYKGKSSKILIIARLEMNEKGKDFFRMLLQFQNEAA